MLFDVMKARQGTPGCHNVVHFNNAGASLQPKPVIEAVMRHLTFEQQVGCYEAEALATDRLEATYNSAAALLGCNRNEIALPENATRAWDMAFYSLPLEPGDRILASMSEYSSNFIGILQRCASTGAVVEPIPNDNSGSLCIDSLMNMIDDRVRVVAVTHVATNGGMVNPAAKIGNAPIDRHLPTELPAVEPTVA